MEFRKSPFFKNSISNYIKNQTTNLVILLTKIQDFSFYLSPTVNSGHFSPHSLVTIILTFLSIPPCSNFYTFFLGARKTLVRLIKNELEV